MLCVAFGDTLTPNGSFQIHTNLGLPPTKANISSSAGVESGSWHYLLSFGGQNAPGPAVPDETAYAEGFIKTYHAVCSSVHVLYAVVAPISMLAFMCVLDAVVALICMLVFTCVLYAVVALICMLVFTRCML